MHCPVKYCAVKPPLNFVFSSSVLLVALSLFAVPNSQATEIPQVEISNGLVRAKIYLPDPATGFYRGTRFDWSGVIGSLEYNGHDYYGLWFTKTDPTVNDFIFHGEDIIAGPCSAATGPVEEFGWNGKALGYDEANPGGTFIKIGVGVLKKPDSQDYSSYRLYDVIDHGKWTVHPHRDSVEFRQELTDPSTGYSYDYHKTVRLLSGKPEMVIENRLKNTGKRAIQTSVYDHNFLVLDKLPTGPDFVISVPFEIATSHPPEKTLAEVKGKQILYLKQLTGHDTVEMPVEGFGSSASDYSITIENEKAGAGMKITGDRPLASEALWSIRSVVAIEPFVTMSIERGQEFSWSYHYSYYSLNDK